MRKGLWVALPALLGLIAPASAQEAQISVNAGKVVNTVSPWLAGSCIEDVNHEIYGGLYDQKIFGESFEEPPPAPNIQGWRTLGGQWRKDGEGVAIDANAGAKLVRDVPAFADGVIQAQLRFPTGEGGNAGVLVRVSAEGVGADAFNGYEISLEPSTKQVILGKHQQNWQPLQRAGAHFSPREWTPLRVELNGPRIRVYVNDSQTPSIDFTDTNAPLLAGTFALRTWNSDVAFRGVSSGSAQAPAEPFATTAVTSVSNQWDIIQSGTPHAQFLRDNVNPYNGSWSQMIEHGAGAGVAGIANRGLNRWGIATQKGQPLSGRLYLRAADVRGVVTVSLQSVDGSRTYGTQKIGKVGTDWARYPISLTPDATDANARFAITLDQPGTLWIDQVTLGGTGAAQFKGLPLRADVAGAMQAEGLQFVRYGGTMVNAPEYRWKKMLGDPDKRPPYRGYWYPYSSNAFGIEEFVRFCEAAGFEGAFAINMEESDQDVADMVEYLNGDANTLWGRRRAQNGHPAPYNVKWIELGNEEVIWSDNAADYDHYVERFNALAAAIHGKDPRIQLVCSAWWRPDSPNMERVFKGVDGKAAYWDLHVWSDDAKSGTTVDRDLTQMQQLFHQWSPNTTMKCVIFEENGNLHNQQRALGHATTLNAVRRHGDFVVASCAANGLQPAGQNDNGWDQGQIFLSPDRVWGMPPFYATQMVAQNFLPQRVDSTTQGDLDVTATRSEDGKMLVLHVVNIGDAAQTASISLQGFEGASSNVQVWTLAGDLGAANTPTNNAVQSVQSRFTGGGTLFNYPFAPHSYTALRLTQ